MLLICLSRDLKAEAILNSSPTVARICQRSHPLLPSASYLAPAEGAGSTAVMQFFDQQGIGTIEGS
jgi:hypothetical protein